MADGVGTDQRGGAAQPRAAVHGEGRALRRQRFAGAEEALDDVHRGTPWTGGALDDGWGMMVGGWLGDDGGLMVVDDGCGG